MKKRREAKEKPIQSPGAVRKGIAQAAMDLKKGRKA